MSFGTEKDLSGKKQTQEALNWTLSVFCEYTKFYPGFVLLPGCPSLDNARDRILDLLDFAQQGPSYSFMKGFSRK